MGKNFLFIDGTNLYAGQYELLGPNKYLDFPEFIKQVQKAARVRLDRIYFYASYSPKLKKLGKKQKLYLKNEALFYRSVKKMGNTTFFKGYRSKTSGKEKEVDVKLAVDIVNLAYLNKYQRLFLLSGDADFMHALEIPKKLKKQIVILALQNRIPQRFTYTYKTLVFVLDRRMTVRIMPKQKIKKFYLDRQGLIRKCV